MDGFAKFYSDHRGRLFAYLVRMSGDAELSRDVLQESYTRYLERYGPGTHSAPLLFTIARNAFFDAVRKARHRPQAPPEADPQGPDPVEAVLVREECRRVLDAFQRLDVTEREVLSLVAGGGLSYRAVAETVGISEANVKVRIHRARLRLRALLKAG